MQKLIEHEGYTAFTAGNGDDAIRMFSEHKPEIVILDIHLPDRNGLVLLKTIRGISPSAAVIVATGCPDAQSRTEAMQMGAVDYIEKPFSLGTLKTLMQAAPRTGSMPQRTEDRAGNIAEDCKVLQQRKP